MRSKMGTIYTLRIPISFFAFLLHLHKFTILSALIRTSKSFASWSNTFVVRLLVEYLRARLLVKYLRARLLVKYLRVRLLVKYLRCSPLG